MAERIAVSNTDQSGLTWKVISEEAPTMFSLDEIGDVFTGQWLGFETITPDDTEQDPFQQARFRGDDGELYATNAGYDLRKSLQPVPQGSLVRLTLMKLVDVGQPSKMKSHRVEVAS